MISPNFLRRQALFITCAIAVMPTLALVAHAQRGNPNPRGLPARTNAQDDPTPPTDDGDKPDEGGTQPAPTQPTTGPAQTGVTGAKFVLAPVDISSECNSTIVQSTSTFRDAAFVLPKIFISVNRLRQQVLNIAPPAVAGDKWRLNFGIYIPHRPKSASALRDNSTDEYYSHSCDLEKQRVLLEDQAYAERKEKFYQDTKDRWWTKIWSHTGPPRPKFTLIPVMPKKIEVTVEGVGTAKIGDDETTMIDAYGWDHDVSIEFPDEASRLRFLAKFDKNKNTNGLGVKVSAKVFWGASREDGRVSCAFSSNEVETSFKNQLKANVGINWAPGGVPIANPPIDFAKVNLRNEIAKAFASQRLECDIQASTDATFTQLANNLVTAVVTDSTFAPSMITLAQGQQTDPGFGPGPIVPGDPGLPPLPPLPIDPPQPCPEGVDPAQFNAETGLTCEPGNKPDTKRGITYKQLISHVEKQVRKNAVISFTATPTTEVVETYERLRGLPEAADEKKMLLTSALGPIEVQPVYTEGVDKNGSKYRIKAMEVGPDGKERVKFSRRTLPQERATHTGIEMIPGRAIRIFPEKRLHQDLQETRTESWATWKEILEFQEIGVDFKIERNSYDNRPSAATRAQQERTDREARRRGETPARRTQFKAPDLKIWDEPFNDPERITRDLPFGATYPVFAGKDGYVKRAFKIVERGQTVKESKPKYFTKRNFFGGTVTKWNGNGQPREWEDGQVPNGFNVGFAGLRISGPISDLLAKGETDQYKVTHSDWGQEEVWIEIEAKQNLGELLLYNMDDHPCFGDVIVSDGKAGTLHDETCKPEWKTRVFADYQPISSWTRPAKPGYWSKEPWYAIQLYSQWIWSDVRKNDGLFDAQDPWLLSSDLAELKAPLPASRSLIQVTLKVMAKEGIPAPRDAQTLIADPKLSTRGMLAVPRALSAEEVYQKQLYPNRMSNIR